jgi:hypothetical protein
VAADRPRAPERGTSLAAWPGLDVVSARGERCWLARRGRHGTGGSCSRWVGRRPTAVVVPESRVRVVSDFERCPFWIELADDELDRLNSLPGAMHEVEQRNYCGLEAGHPGRHVSATQANGDGSRYKWWWIWWSAETGQYTSAIAAECPAAVPDPLSPQETAYCLLPVDHIGRHRF